MRGLGVYLLTILAMVLGLNVVSPAQTQPLLTRHVREVTRTGQAKPVGHLPPDQIMTLDVVLKLRDQAALDSFVKELYDPSSSS
ncbi:MAG: hypothetical protein WAK48_16135, partial [Candidatus Acidiferrum sp.]